MAQITDKVMRHMGYDQSAFNVEFFWNEHDDQIWFLEINIRIPQSHSDLFIKVDGVSNHQVMLNVALNRDPQFPQRKGKFRVAGKFFLREYQDKQITGIPTKEDLEEISREIPGALFDIQSKAGMKLSDIPEQASYSYATAFIYLGADSQRELLEKFRQCRKMLKFKYKDITIPVVSPEKAVAALPDHEPRVGIEVLTSPTKLISEHDAAPDAEKADMS